MELELANQGGLLVRKPEGAYRARELHTALVAAMPSLGASLPENQGPHALLSELEAVVMSALNQGRLTEAQALVGVIESALERPDLHEELENAFQISFLVPSLLLGSPAGRSLWAVITPKLRQLLITYYGEPLK